MLRKRKNLELLSPEKLPVFSSFCWCRVQAAWTSMLRKQGKVLAFLPIELLYPEKLPRFFILLLVPRHTAR